MGIYICGANERSQRCTKNYKYTVDWQCDGHKSEWSFIY